MARLLVICAVILCVIGGARDRFDHWVDQTELPSLAIEHSKEIRDRNGLLLRPFTVSDGRWRLRSQLTNIDAKYIDYLLNYEDKRFYNHNGVDPIALTRAAFQSVWNGRIVSGGSTLTMQVARLLEDGPTGTWKGKFRQIRVALALERQLTKREILSLYVNRAPFGGNLEGVRAATLAYFGKEPRRLTEAEAALLVALPQSPETRRPDRFLGNAHDARARVFDRSFSANLLDPDTLDSAKTDPISTERHEFPALAPHLTERYSNSETIGDLTIDANLQSQLEEMAERAVVDAGNRLSVAVLVANHQSGEILAQVGSSGYKADNRQGFVDMTQAIRSPGSTLKPLVYGLSFDQGLAHPQTLIEDRPTEFGTYAPQNFDGQFRGTLPIEDALRLSLNIPVVSLTEAVGPARVLAHIHRSGAETKLPGAKPGLAIALGGIGINLENLVQLYAALANGGKPVELSALHAPKTGLRQQVLSAEAAWMIGDILSQIPPPIGAAHTGVAYKTGTSYGHRDAWAIGYDGKHVIGVWLGRPDGSSVPGAFGGDLAAPVLFEAFAILKPKIDRLPPPPPNTLLVSHTNLPEQLKVFRNRNAVFSEDVDAPRLIFPPDGAELLTSELGVSGKIRNGKPPFTWLADGLPVRLNSFERSEILPIQAKGFVTLTVIDANGLSASSRVWMD